MLRMGVGEEVGVVVGFFGGGRGCLCRGFERMGTTEDVIYGVKDRTHLVRERALQRMRKELPRLDGTSTLEVAGRLEEALKEEETIKSWESQTGLFLACKELLDLGSGAWPAEEKLAFARNVDDRALEALSHAEVRLRSVSFSLITQPIQRNENRGGNSRTDPQTKRNRYPDLLTPREDRFGPFP